MPITLLFILFHSWLDALLTRNTTLRQHWSSFHHRFPAPITRNLSLPSHQQRYVRLYKAPYHPLAWLLFVVACSVISGGTGRFCAA